MSIRCPLCGSAASATHLGGRRQHIDCPNCTEFVVHRRAERLIDTLTQDNRDKMSERARSVDDPAFICVLAWVPADERGPDRVAVESRPRSWVLAP